MLRLERGAEPAVLTKKKNEWTREFVEFDGPRSAMPASLRYRYRAPEIKSALVARSHGKCMYCESPVTRTHPGEIEHIFPVSVRPELVVEWGNLGFVCHECNWRKLDYHDPDLPLVDPYSEDPGDHVLIVGPVIRHRPGSVRGRKTIKQVGLDRPELVEARMERIRGLEALLDQVARLSEAERAVVQSEIERELADDRPYSGTGRAYVRVAISSP
jgi:hypothetical protein